MTHPVTPPRTIVPGPDHTLLRRVVKVRSNVPEVERLVLVHTDAVRISLRDTGPDGSRDETTVGDTAIHLLWATDDASAHLTVDDRRTPIAPGDMIVLPGGSRWHASPNLILCDISGIADAPGANTRVFFRGPTHGVETFHGYNRETVYPAPPGLALSRWKITQPLQLPPSPYERFLVGLAAPVAMLWPGGTDLIGRGECRRVPAGCGPLTVLPDGLGYVLVVKCSSDNRV